MLIGVIVVVAFTAGGGRAPADLVILNRGDVNTLDLHRMSWLQDLRVAAGLWEGLVRSNTNDPNFAPGPAMAERWSISDDRRMYTFHLRPGLKWSNGEPFVAEDFRRTWLRAIMPDTGGDYLSLFGLIRGVRDFVAWREKELATFAGSGLEGTAREAAAAELWARTRARYDETVGVRAPDARTLVIELERPAPAFLEILAYEVTFPLYMPTVEKFQRIDPRTGRVVNDPAWTRPPHLVSNGPYRLAAWRFKREMRLERNEHYWNASAVEAGSISMPTIDDPGAALVATRTGAADWLTDVSADARRDLIAAKAEFHAEHADAVASLKRQGLGPIAIDARLPPDPRNQVHVLPSFGTFFLNFNCGPTLPDGRANPFRDARVRRAFSMALNKQAVAEIRGIGEPVAGSLIPPGALAGYTPPRGLTSDGDMARQALMDAGFLHGDQFITVEILFNKDAGHDQVVQAIAQDWARELGVRVVLRQKERKVFREDLKSRRYMISTANWFGDYGDPVTFLDIHRSTDGNNDRGYSRPEFDALLDAAASEADPAARLRLLEQAEAMLIEDAPLLPLVHECSVYLFDPHRITGITDHPRQKQQLGLLRKR